MPVSNQGSRFEQPVLVVMPVAAQGMIGTSSLECILSLKLRTFKHEASCVYIVRRIEPEGNLPQDCRACLCPAFTCDSFGCGRHPRSCRGRFLHAHVVEGRELQRSAPPAGRLKA